MKDWHRFTVEQWLQLTPPCRETFNQWVLRHGVELDDLYAVDIDGWEVTFHRYANPRQLVGGSVKKMPPLTMEAVSPFPLALSFPTVFTEHRLRERLAELDDDDFDPENMHWREDTLWLDTLTAIAEGRLEEGLTPAAAAAIAIQTLRIDFPRYYA